MQDIDMRTADDREDERQDRTDNIPFYDKVWSAPRTGPGAFRAGDHVRSLANGNRLLGVIAVNADGTLHLWAHSHGHIWDADPMHWERCLRNEELKCAA